ncbi:MAG: hypothetical protein NXI16_07610 [Alphaproteobacteria bacterium]|nr:hypothetical protein [Alphaproteobacteria bacterium]
MKTLPIILFLGIHLAAALWLSVKPNWQPGGEVFVVFDPRFDPEQVLSAVIHAGGMVVRGTGGAVVATSSNPDFPAALWDHGGLLILNPVIEGACAALI